MKIPPDHPLRLELHAEVHARPSERLAAPVRVTFLALWSEAGTFADEWQHVRSLVLRLGHDAPSYPAKHFSADLGPFRLKWERHTEFTRYKFIVPGQGRDPFVDTALLAVPADWLAVLPGSVMVAAHAAVLPATGARADDSSLSEAHFAGNMLIGAELAAGAGAAYTDFRLHDGYSRFLVHDHGMTARQAGRMIQRLFEIETYRMMALLALPVAQQLNPFLSDAERELSQITTSLIGATNLDEPGLLDRLTRLEAAMESRASDNTYRFEAAFAYHELVRRRIDELRETRIQGMQTFREFTERRLAPAMSTCRSTSLRLESLSERVARATQLLSTRVDLTREKQNQALLESMNRRAAAQLRLQQTVEGLSVAAITYYVVGLVGYFAKGAKATGLGIDPELTMAISIPVVVLIAALGLRRLRRRITRTDQSLRAANSETS